MTRKEYAEYERSVAKFFENEGIDNLTTISDESGNTEPYFSWSSCECCGSHLGGDRYDCNGYNPKTGEIYEYSVCVDCMYYAEYGKLDDLTMMELE